MDINHIEHIRRLLVSRDLAERQQGYERALSFGDLSAVLGETLVSDGVVEVPFTDVNATIIQCLLTLPAYQDYAELSVRIELPKGTYRQPTWQLWRDKSASMEPHLGITRLDISKSDIESAAELAVFTKLNRLSLASLRKLSTLGDISALEELTYFEVFQCEALASIATLSTLTSLKELHLCGCGPIDDNLFEDIGFLEPLEALERLSMNDVPPYSFGFRGWDYGISKLTKLTSLALEHYRAADLSPGEDAAAQLIVSSLRSLSLSYSRALTDLDGLVVGNACSHDFLDDIDDDERRELIERRPRLAHLESLEVIECTELLNVDAIAWLDTLTTIDLRGCTKLPQTWQKRHEGRESCDALRADIRQQPSQDRFVRLQQMTGLAL